METYGELEAKQRDSRSCQFTPEKVSISFVERSEWGPKPVFDKGCEPVNAVSQFTDLVISVASPKIYITGLLTGDWKPQVVCKQ